MEGVDHKKGSAGIRGIVSPYLPYSPINRKKGNRKMPEEFKIIIQNKLLTEKRDIYVYHSFTQSSHIISTNSSIVLPLKTAAEKDYLSISIPGGPGPLIKGCRVNLPAWADFKFSAQGEVTVSHCHTINRIILHFPPGPQKWELKIMRIANHSPGSPLTNDRITVCDHVTANGKNAASRCVTSRLKKRRKSNE